MLAKVLNYVPGFRSKKTWKISIASIYYFICFVVLFVDPLFSLSMASSPFFYCNLKHLKKIFKKSSTDSTANTSSNLPLNNPMPSIQVSTIPSQNTYTPRYNENYNTNTKTEHKYKKVNLLTKKWSEACFEEFIALDIETTGFMPNRDHIIEIAAIKYKNGIESEKFITLIKPPIKISAKITSINNITNEMVANSPSIEEIIPKFCNFVKDSIIVAHNASFDVNFIEYVANKNNLDIDNAVVDTLQICRKLYPNFENHKLGTICSKLGIELIDAHRAKSDARACASIVLKCIELYKKDISA